jgi:two-component system nitrogen regulation sensor histidine kinase NtrY
LTVTLALTTLYFREIETVSLFPENILVLTLLQLNVILTVLLLLLLSRNLIKHYFEKRQRALGAGFRGKLIAAFVGFSAIPSLLLLIVASGLLTNSIENWFSIQVERPLEHSLDVANRYAEDQKTLIREVSKTLRQNASLSDLSTEAGRQELLSLLNLKLREYPLAGLEVIIPGHDWPLRVRKLDQPGLVLPSPPPEAVSQAVRGQEVLLNTRLHNGEIVRLISPVDMKMATPEGGTNELRGALVADLFLPESITSKMEEITAAYQDYTQLKAFKNPIKQSYLLSFVVLTFVILFSASWFGFYLAKGITVPLQKLVEGTRQVAQGNLDFRIEARANDETGLLVDSFNKMTEDLSTSKSRLEEANQKILSSYAELDQRRMYIETVLDNITSGIISLDRESRITTVNRAAERLLQLPASEVRGKPARDAFQAFRLEPLASVIEQALGRPNDLFAKEIHLDVEGKMHVLSVSVSFLRKGSWNDLGRVMVIDDLTDLIKAQKAAAWQEVAQRIAHEIKNPLTPIQLSVERLRKKLTEQATDFPLVFDEATRTILSEVNSLKALVDEFSGFARLPVIKPAPTRIEDILQEVASLYRSAHKDITIQTDVDPAIPPLMLDRQQIKRVLVNLFDNAVEAMNRSGRIWASARRDPVQRRAVIEVADEGPGIPPEDHDKLFLPYFSKKKTGTGLGLAIVHRIISDHNGAIRVRNREPHGARIIIELPL